MWTESLQWVDKKKQKNWMEAESSCGVFMRFIRWASSSACGWWQWDTWNDDVALLPVALHQHPLQASYRASYSAPGTADHGVLKGVSSWQRRNEAEHPCCNCHLLGSLFEEPKRRLKCQRELCLPVWKLTLPHVHHYQAAVFLFGRAGWRQSRFMAKNRSSLQRFFFFLVFYMHG